MNAETEFHTFQQADIITASMGPRSHERGNSATRLRPKTRHSLQWGRVLMNAETEFHTFQQADIITLQWGRVLMNAETMA